MVKIYIDLDNTLTDFDTAVWELGPEATEGISENATDVQIKKMRSIIEAAGSDFWSNMSWLPEGPKLWEALKPYKPVLLSAPGEFTCSQAGKQDWVNKNLPGTTLFLDNEKFRYADRDAILIDDLLGNIEAWKEAGGLAIQHKDTDTTLKELQDLIKRNKLGESMGRLSSIADLLRQAALLSVKPKIYPKEELPGYTLPSKVTMEKNIAKLWEEEHGDFRKFKNKIETTYQSWIDDRNNRKIFNEALLDATKKNIGLNIEGEVIQLRH